MTRAHNVWGAMLIALSAGALLAGCAGTVTADEVAGAIIEELDHAGVAGTEVSCSGPLTAVVGRSATCAYTVDGQVVDAVATVVEVTSGRAHFAFTTTARPIAEVALERRLSLDVSRHGGAAATFDCPADLPATMGAQLLCAGADGHSARVSVTEVTGGRVRYSVERV